MDRSASLNLSIGLPLRNKEELDSFIAQISDPSSPNYKHYLTPEQFTAKYGPTEEDYQAVVDFAQQHGLMVTKTHSNRLLVSVTGAVPDVEKAFHVNMVHYQHPVRGEFYSADREPTMDLDVAIQHISGLDNFIVPKPMDLKAEAAARAYVSGSGPSGTFIGGDFRAAYAPGVTLNGSGQKIALLELDGFYPGDLTKNFAKAGLPVSAVETKLLDGLTGAAGPNNDEVILDIMMAAYMAPSATIVVYEGAATDDVLNQIAIDNSAKQISSSWGFGEDSVTEQIFEEFIAQGQSFFQASGDSGAYTNGVGAPSDDPYVTSVGGTVLATSGAGGPWSNESVWSGSGGGKSTTYTIPIYQQNLNMTAAGGSTTMRNIPDVAAAASGIYLIYNNGGGGSVGGTSASAPLWAGFAALANQQAVANGLGPIGFINPTLYTIGSGGDYSTDMHDIKAGSNGFKAVTGYDLATGWGSPAGQGMINDLTTPSGSFFTLSAAPSSLTLLAYQPVATNITVNPGANFNSVVVYSVSGVPNNVEVIFNSSSNNAGGLTFMSLGATPGTYTVTVTGTTGSVSTSVPLVVTIPAPGFNLMSSASNVTLLVGGSSAASTIKVNDNGGFSGSVSLAVSGLPTGVTATLSPSSTATTSTLTLKPGASAVPGTYNVLVSGKCGSYTGSAKIQITIPQPNFALTSTASNLTSLVGGASATSNIGVANPVGLAANVALKVSGLPTGVTASLTSSSINASSSANVSTLSLKAGATAVPGTYTVTVTGTSATATRTANIQIVIPQPSFSLAASTSALTMVTQRANTTSISVANPVGLVSNVSLKVSGVPAGVTATLSSSSINPNSTARSSTLTVVSGMKAVPGTYTLAVTAASATASQSIPVTITIP
jgi:uncharacterized membrane protein